MKKFARTVACIFLLSISSLFFVNMSAPSARQDLLTEMSDFWKRNASYTGPCKSGTCTTKYATVSLRMDPHNSRLATTPDANGLIGEFHISYDPPLNMQIPYRLSTPVDHPLPGPIIRMIDAVPKSAYIRVSVFLFNNLAIKDALVRALQRGTVVQVITSDVYRNADSSIDDDNESGESQADIDKALVVKQDLLKNMDPASASFLLFCTKKRSGRPQDPGGCLSERLNHHKFVTFSRVCRYGLNAKNACTVPVGSDKYAAYYNNVVAQSSYNFTDRPRHAYETTSVFIGNDKLYATYVHYFGQQKKYQNQKTPDNFVFRYKIQIKDSVLEVQGTPRAKEAPRRYGFLASSFDGIKCVEDKKKTIIRVATSHYHDKDDVTEEVYNRLLELKKAGCEIRVLVKKNLKTEDPVTFANMTKNFGARLLASPYNTYANMHTKFAVVETPTASKRMVMFGTLSPHELSQVNTDEMWNVWRNPIKESFDFYKNTFEQNYRAAIYSP